MIESVFEVKNYKMNKYTFIFCFVPIARQIITDVNIGRDHMQNIINVVN